VESNGGRGIQQTLTDSKLEKGKPSQLSKNRLEAFSDGVFAVIITIMVLDMKVPQGTDLHALKSVVPVFLCYVLSYVYVGIYWKIITICCTHPNA
jgi:uncharacterized membrane protein